MNRTREEWSRVKPSAVAGGSKAQAENVMKMMLQDIEVLHREAEAREKDLLGANVMLRIAARPSANDQISEERMHALLVEAVKNVGSQKAWALAGDVSPQYVNDCIRRWKPIGIGISKVFGYQPVTVYQPLEELDRAPVGRSKAIYEPPKYRIRSDGVKVFEPDLPKITEYEAND